MKKFIPVVFAGWFFLMSGTPDFQRVFKVPNFDTEAECEDFRQTMDEFNYTLPCAFEEAYTLPNGTRFKKMRALVQHILRKFHGS